MDSDAARYCAEQVRRYDHDRYLCALFAPEPARAHVLAIYAFNVEIARIRELVREPMMGQIRLQWWREVVEGAVPRDQPVALALAEAIRVCALSRPAFLRLLAARERDLIQEAPANYAALEEYADATSASVAQLALEALGMREPAAHAAGRDVGIAWALTGLLRAVAFHGLQRRLYLPRDRLDNAGVRDEQIFTGRAGAALAPIARDIAGRARAHLAAARARRGAVPRAAVPALLPAMLADLYLNRLERAGFSLFDPAVQQRPGSRALRLAWAASRGRY